MARLTRILSADIVKAKTEQLTKAVGKQDQPRLLEVATGSED